MLAILGPISPSGGALSLVPVNELLKELLVHIGGIDGRRMRPHVSIHRRGPLTLSLGLGGRMGLSHNMVRCDSPLIVGSERHRGSAGSAHGRRWYHAKGGIRRRDGGVHQGLRGARKEMLSMGYGNLLGQRLGLRPSACRSLGRGRQLRSVDGSHRWYWLCACRSDIG